MEAGLFSQYIQSITGSVPYAIFGNIGALYESVHNKMHNNRYTHEKLQGIVYQNIEKKLGNFNQERISNNRNFTFSIHENFTGNPLLYKLSFLCHSNKSNNQSILLSNNSEFVTLLTIRFSFKLTTSSNHLNIHLSIFIVSFPFIPVRFSTPLYLNLSIRLALFISTQTTYLKHD